MSVADKLVLKTVAELSEAVARRVMRWKKFQPKNYVKHYWHWMPARLPKKDWCPVESVYIPGEYNSPDTPGGFTLLDPRHERLVVDAMREKGFRRRVLDHPDFIGVTFAKDRENGAHTGQDEGIATGLAALRALGVDVEWPEEVQHASG